MNQNEVAVDRAHDPGFGPVRGNGQGPDHYFIVYLKGNFYHLGSACNGVPLFNAIIQSSARFVLRPIFEPHGLSPFIRISSFQLLQAFAELDPGPTSFLSNF
ncbi:MAG: hypothetical protein ABSE08_04180 [Syntrophobacteraceae bacterium]